MQETGLPLLIHGEVTDHEVDVFDREAAFIDRILQPLRKSLPALRVVFEHITTKDAVDYVRDTDGEIAATITAHHLMYNRNAIFQGGIRPHYYCLPILKREVHRQALVDAATSGSPRFFLGTDSAPHPKGLKEHACGCAGCYTALHAMLEARQAAGLTQAEVATRMGTTVSAVSRLEASLRSEKHSPSFATLRKYAQACGKKLVIQMV
jgi:dihydroorotase